MKSNIFATTETKFKSTDYGRIQKKSHYEEITLWYNIKKVKGK